MKNLAIFGLAAASASMAAGSLWNMDVENKGQVQTPEVLACAWTYQEGDPCYQSTGGWWYAYVGDKEDKETGAKNDYSISPIDYNADGTYKLITVDESDGSILPNGNLQEGVGLVVTMSGTGNGSDSSPAIIGVGWNWNKAETQINVSDFGGLCFGYSWTGTQALDVELSQGETTDKAAGWNTWTAKMAPATGGSVDLPWAKFQNGGNWGQPNPLEDVTANMVAVKVRLKNPTTSPVSGTLTISEVGKAGEGCGAGGSGTPSTPTAIASVAQSSAKAILSGRTLSFSGINSDASYEIVSLQGQVVKSGVVSSSINLSSLNAGVYMVRVAGKSVNMNQKILVK